MLFRSEIFLGGAARPRNWLALPADATRLTTRHYFEEKHPVAADWSIASATSR